MKGEIRAADERQEARGERREERQEGIEARSER
jgi:hypothetical protein